MKISEQRLKEITEGIHRQNELYNFPTMPNKKKKKKKKTDK